MIPPDRVKSNPIESRPPRGRPRSAEARRAVLRAARQILESDGLTAVTIERVAALAGVGKPTIYRSWPNAQSVAMAALMEGEPAPEVAVVPKAGLDALRRQLRQIVDVFTTRTGRSVTQMLAASDSETELSKVFRHHFILARRDEGRQHLEQARAAGQLREDADLEIALDLIYAPIFYRLLVGHAPLNAAFVDAVLEHALEGLKPQRRQKRIPPVT